jgi:hypothetical protein
VRHISHAVPSYFDKRTVHGLSLSKSFASRLTQSFLVLHRIYETTDRHSLKRFILSVEFAFTALMLLLIAGV